LSQLRGIPVAQYHAQMPAPTRLSTGLPLIELARMSDPVSSTPFKRTRMCDWRAVPACA
jgi:hypothetical protein